MTNHSLYLITKIHINKFNKEQHPQTKITRKYNKIFKKISATEE